MTITQLGYLGIGARDLDAWHEYATALLGLQVSQRGADGSLYLRMDDYAYRLIVQPTGEDDLTFTGWQVKDSAALAAVAQRVRAAGIEVEEGDATARARNVLGLIRFKDPSDLSVEVYYGPFIDNPHPFCSPRAISRFVTGERGELGLGHVVLFGPNPEATLAFYTDVLGFSLSDYIDLRRGGSGPGMRLAFLHCNPRHHSLALGVPIDGPRPPAPPNGTGNGAAQPAPPSGPPKRLNHIMLELGELDDVGITYWLCRDRGLQPGELGRHTNDHMFSFYVPAPSGFQVEYGYGGLLVNDTNWVVQYYGSTSIWGHSFGRPLAPPAAGPVPAALAGSAR